MIKVNNNIDKLIAFNPALDPKFRKSQRILTPTTVVEPLDLVEKFQNEGWEINSSQSLKDKRGRFNSTHLKFSNKDLTFKEKNETGGYANLNLNINYSDLGVLTSLGAQRMICDNSIITNEQIFGDTIQLPKYQETQFKRFLRSLDIEVNKIYTNFEDIQNTTLNQDKQERLAQIAWNSRFNFFKNKSQYLQLLTANRIEDEGNNAWNVYNRIQENIIKPGMIKNENNKPLMMSLNPLKEKRINQKLYSGLQRVLN